VIVGVIVIPHVIVAAHVIVNANVGVIDQSATAAAPSRGGVERAHM